jgi:hypothetical protein
MPRLSTLVEARRSDQSRIGRDQPVNRPGSAGHPDPERFAAEFSGSERTVAQYLLAEVLDRQSEEVGRLLLRTSVLEWVNGELADALTGESGMLQDLEEANAFVVSLDAARSWFRYHYLWHYTAHAARIAQILSLLAGSRPAPPPIWPQPPRPTPHRQRGRSLVRHRLAARAHARQEARTSSPERTAPAIAGSRNARRDKARPPGLLGTPRRPRVRTDHTSHSSSRPLP